MGSGDCGRGERPGGALSAVVELLGLVDGGDGKGAEMKTVAVEGPELIAQAGPVVGEPSLKQPSLLGAGFQGFPVCGGFRVEPGDEFAALGKQELKARQVVWIGLEQPRAGGVEKFDQLRGRFHGG